MANPDKVGIKWSVHYPHEKLELRFVKNREFDKLSFHNLVAGELEIILDETDKISVKEKEARLAILRAMSYHHEYLQIEELRDCYDSVMKEVEQGRSVWNRVLADKAHQFYEFRANLLTRESIARQAAAKNNSSTKKPKDINEKIVYCNKYNREGGCVFAGHHEGKFNSKIVKKWHVCRKCLFDTKKKEFHSEVDTNCPRRQN